MQLIEVDPYDIHFGDIVLERHWEKVSNWITPDAENFENKIHLLCSIARNGIVDPVIVYTIPQDKNERLHILMKKEGHTEPFLGLWCWVGTQRIRIARWLGIPKIKALIVNEDKDTQLNIEKAQKYFKKKITAFVSPKLERWMIKGVEENDDHNEIY